MSNPTYKSMYVWPNEAFPFRVYFSSKNLRIFIIENLQHNFNWLKEHHRKIKPSDKFLVILGSHWNEHLLKNALDMFEYLGLSKDNFFILFNDERDEKLFSQSGIKGDIINQNAWLDYNASMKIIPDTTKEYDAVYVGRLIAVKRHFLAKKVKNLALVSGQLYGNNIEAEAPPYIYRNEKQLTPDEVCKKINESRCGLILSAKEGACFASSEYLLCGIPVVSTHSEGGRSIWYDEYNSIVCGDNEEEIAAAVSYFASADRDPQTIRNRHINLSTIFRAKFINILANLFYEYDVYNTDPNQYFIENYFHKMRNSIKPNFGDIFQ